MSVCIVFSCDTNYFPLAKGLVLSLADFGIPNDDLVLCIADVGCSDTDREWLSAHEVKIVPFNALDHYSFRRPDRVKRHYGSLLCRPLIPVLFPGHEIYLHIDADIWIQNIQSLYDYIDICRRKPDIVAITPCVDASYIHEYIKTSENVGSMVRLYSTLYGEEAKITYPFRPVLSCGMFAMHRDSDVWGLWREHLNRNFDLDFFKESDRPASEQAALNYILFNSMRFIPLSASHNYNCHAGVPVRLSSSGKVASGFQPYPEIDIIHLTCFEVNRLTYYNNALLYDMGQYLTDHDRKTLKLI
jgi:hypothetical protein